MGNIQKNMDQFLALLAYIKKAKTQDFYINVEKSARDAFYEYWNGCLIVVEKINDIIGEDYGKFILDSKLKKALNNVNIIGVMNNFHKELITLLNDIDISFEHINNMEFEFSEVRFDDTTGVFYVKGYDTKDDSYEQLPLIELKLSPDEVVKSEDDKYVSNILNNYFQTIDDAIKPCIEFAKNAKADENKAKEDRERQLYERLKLKFEQDQYGNDIFEK